MAYYLIDFRSAKQFFVDFADDPNATVDAYTVSQLDDIACGDCDFTTSTDTLPGALLTGDVVFIQTPKCCCSSMDLSLIDDITDGWEASNNQPIDISVFLINCNTFPDSIT